MAQVTHIVGYT